MANKSVIVTEPAVSKVVVMEVRCDGVGNVTSLKGQVSAVTDDAPTFHDGAFEFDVSSLPAATQTAVDDLAAECLTRFLAQHGF